MCPAGPTPKPWSGVSPAVPGVAYSALWFNEGGLRRALAFKDKLTLSGSISLSASEAFSIKNLNRDRAGQIAAMRSFVRVHQEAGVPIDRIIVMAVVRLQFCRRHCAGAGGRRGCGWACHRSATPASSCGQLSLADSMGWATPRRVAAAVGAVRERWPELEIALHLHDTRGQGIACAYEGLRLGVTAFDAAVAGLGGCPFAGQPGAPGNIATEELAIICEEMGIETGLDIEALIEAGAACRAVVGHPPAERGAPLRHARLVPAEGGMSAASKPLAGVRVLDFGHTIMGPCAGVVFADLGADVVKIEPAGRRSDAPPAGLCRGLLRDLQSQQALDRDRSQASRRAGDRASARARCGHRAGELRARHDRAAALQLG